LKPHNNVRFYASDAFYNPSNVRLSNMKYGSFSKSSGTDAFGVYGSSTGG